MPQDLGGDRSIGERIAHHRKNLGLTQEGLAMRLFRSKSWVTKIERGERPLDSVRTLVDVARALGVQVRDLTGQPWFPESGGPGHDAIPAIRRALTSLTPASTGPDGQPIEPRDPTSLRADVLAAGRLWQTDRHCYSAVVPLLPDLIAEVRLAAAAAAEGEQRHAANRTFALLCQLLQEVMARLGEIDLAWIAADQSLRATADTNNDPALEAASAWRVCHAALRMDNLDEVYNVAAGAIGKLRRVLRDEPSPESLSAYGGLHLVGAVAAIRASDPIATDRFLGEARRAAGELGDGRNDFWMTFGPANVAIHDAEVLLERGEVAAALRHATTVDLSALPSLERRSTHYVNVARAHALRRHDAEALTAMLQAERFNPEGLSYNMLARDLVRALLRRERRQTMAGLRGLARRLHLLD
jgi:transcriptional regulator with XRE-family HTH domain